MNTKIMSRLHIIFAGIILAVSPGLKAQSEGLVPKTPLWQRVPSTYISPEAVIAAMQKKATLSLNSALTSNTVAPASAQEIVSLAASLGNDPVQIFDYVRNHIEYTCYYGSRKGALLTLLEGSGNDHDQCALLVAMLNAAGYSGTQYCESNMDIPYTPLTANYGNNVEEWLGLPDEPGPRLTFEQAFPSQAKPAGSDLQSKRSFFAVQYFVRNGVSAVSTANPDCISVTRTWVQLTTGKGVFQLDPAFKNYAAIQGLDLADLSGYDRSWFLNSNNVSVQDTDNSTYYQHLDDGALKSHLGCLTSTLLGNIRNNYPGYSVEHIISGRSIVQVVHSSLADASFPLPSGIVKQWKDIPDNQKSTVRISYGDGGPKAVVDITLNLCDLAGGRLSLTFDTTGINANSNLVYLSLDDTILASGPVLGNTFPLTMLVTHPGLFSVHGASSTAMYNKTDHNYMYALLYAYDTSGRVLKQRQDKLDAYRKDPVKNAKQILCESLNIMGLNWMHQTGVMQKIIANRLGVACVNQHRMGRMSQEHGYYIDVYNQVESSYSFSGNISNEEMAIHVPALLASAMEHGVIQQMQSGASAASTINILRDANNISLDKAKKLYQKIYMASPSTWSQIRSTLVVGNYSPNILSQVDQYFVNSTNNSVFNQDNLALFPASGQVSQGNHWKGVGYLIRTPTEADMIIGGGVQGGYSTDFSTVQAAPIYNWYSSNPMNFVDNGLSVAAASPYITPAAYGADPVDMATGAFTYGMKDMETGVESAPRGLSFVRSYSSARHTTDDQYLGKGWTHNLDVRATVRTPVEESLGLGTPEQCAPLLVAATVMLDLYRVDDTPKEWGMAVHTAGWLVDQMTNAGVSVHVGPQTFQFIKMPDGSYIAPAGSTATMSKTGSIYQLTERLGNTITFDAYNRASTITDPDNKKMTFYYNGNAADSTINYVKDAYNRTYTFGYSGKSNHISSVQDSTSVTDSSSLTTARTRKVSFGYDANWNLISATDPELQVAHFDYTLSGDPSTQAALSYIRRVRDRSNATVVESDYDSFGRVITQRALGLGTNTTSLRYTGFATYETDPLGGVTTYLFDERGRNNGTIAPDGTTSSWIYDGQDQVVQSTNGVGASTYFQYDAYRNVIRIDYPEGGGSARNIYDSLHRLTQSIDPDGKTISRVYNTGNLKNRPDSVIVVGGGSTSYTYKPTTDPGAGRVSTITDPDGFITSYTYDSYGQPLSVQKPGGYLTHYTTNPRGNITDVTDPKGITTHTVYNRRCQPTEVVHDYKGANAATEDIAYDNEGRTYIQTAPPDNVKGDQRFTTTSTYSASGKPLAITYNANTNSAACEKNTYDVRDWVQSTSDIDNRQTIYTSNSAGLLLSKTLQDGRSISQTQDGLGRITSSVTPGAPNNRVKQISYGVTGAGDQTTGCPKITTVTADQRTAITELSPGGKMRYHKDRRGNIWEFQYDTVGRPSKIINATHAIWATGYTAAGRLNQVTAPSGKTSAYTYNQTTGRLSNVTDGYGTTNSISTTFSSYDSNGNILSLSESRGGSTFGISKTYDRLNRLASRTDENGSIVSYQYYPSGKLRLLVYPGGNATTGAGCVQYTYCQSGRLYQVIDNLGSTTRTTTYTWNVDGRLASILRPNNTRRDIQYDSAGRPQMITESTTTGILIHLQKLTYYPSDEVNTRYVIPSFTNGNSTPVPTVTSMEYDAANQLTSFSSGSVPNITVAYDPDGNMTSGPLPNGSQGTYGYDARNRLISAGGSTFTYDSEGLRKTVTEAGVTATYVMDASGPGKVLTRTKNGVVTRYVWGVGLCYEVDPTGASTTYHYDATGSTIALTDDTANIIEKVEYSPYGFITRRWNTSGTYRDTPFLYTGMLGNETEANGLVHMRARYYNPLLGRVLNSDPAREGWNWHAYAGGNPLGYVDPSGLGTDAALDVVQTALAFVGLVPGIGIAADMLNSAISIGRGNYGQAVMYGVAAVTGGAMSLAVCMEARVGVSLETSLASGALETELGIASGALQTETGIAANTAQRQTMATGAEWYDYFAGKYGAQNVDWVSGSGRTITWPTELPMPATTSMIRVPPPVRSGSFVRELESVAGPRPPGGIAHHNQPLGLGGIDDGALNGSWQISDPHADGHGLLNPQVNVVPYGTQIRIKPR